MPGPLLPCEYGHERQKNDGGEFVALDRVGGGCTPRIVHSRHLVNIRLGGRVRRISWIGCRRELARG